MAIKAMIFGTDELYPQLENFYDLEVQRGNLEIVSYAVMEGDSINFYKKIGGGAAYRPA